MKHSELLAELQRVSDALGAACSPDAPVRVVVDIALGNIRTAWEHDGLVAQIDKLKTELARGRFGDLKPRAIAVLCALRSGPRTANQIGTAIGDGSKPSGRRATDDLLVGMGRIGQHLDEEDRLVREAADQQARAIVSAEHGVPLSKVQVLGQGTEVLSRCPYGPMPREAGAGHWRDWHRGHGCHLDPDRVGGK